MTLGRLKRVALAVGAAGAAACVLGAILDRASFYRAYLFGFLFWSGVATSSAGLLMIHRLTGGAWGTDLRRPLRAAAGTLPGLFVLFLPIIPGLATLYPWARPGAEPHPYLNAPFFLLRAAVCFLVWGALGWALSRDRLGRLSGPGLLALGFTMTFASVDWAMSLEPRWYSTSYGLLFIGGQTLSALAFAVLLAGRLTKDVQASLHDWGNLTLTFLLLWAYLAFTQYLIIWSADLPEETSWYLRRTSDGWSAMAVGLALLHFAGPFAALLSTRVKRSARGLAAVAGLLFVMRFVDLYWMIAPSMAAGGPRPHALDVAAPAAIGGLWLAAALRREAA